MRFFDISPGDHTRVIGRVSLAVVLFTASLFFPASRVESTPREIPVTTVPGNTIRFQPPSYRLRGMGDLQLVVRDEYTEINLWDFAGVTAGVGIDRDSTSLDLWLSGGREKTDVDEGSIKRETFREEGGVFGTEGVIRFSPTLALGVDAGILSVSRAVPFGDGVNTQLSLTVPAANVFGSGRLVGPILWGLSGLFATESYTLRFWEDKVDGDVVKIGQRGSKIDPPNFFITDRGEVDVTGLGGSLAYYNPESGLRCLLSQSAQRRSPLSGDRHAASLRYVRAARHLDVRLCLHL